MLEAIFDPSLRFLEGVFFGIAFASVWDAPRRTSAVLGGIIGVIGGAAITGVVFADGINAAIAYTIFAMLGGVLGIIVLSTRHLFSSLRKKAG